MNSDNQQHYSSRRGFLSNGSLALGVPMIMTAQASAYSTEPEASRHPSFESRLHVAHPFWPAAKMTLVTDNLRHRSRGSFIIPLDDKWIIGWRDAANHTANDGKSTVTICDTYNAGQTLSRERVIFSADGKYELTDVRGWRMAHNRIGVFGSRRNVQGKKKNGTDAPAFLYSDDGGFTWSTKILSNLPGYSPSFTVSPFPASVGGHDTEGWVLFCDGDGDVRGVATRDNGNTWESWIAIAGNQKLGGEVSVVQLGESNRWIMLARPDRNAVTPIYKSADLVDWEGPFDSKAFVGKNSSTLIYHKGHVTHLCASRPHHFPRDKPVDERAIRVNNQVFQGLVTRTQEAEALWQDPTQWPEWDILAYVPEIHFDGTFKEINGVWYGIFGAHESWSKFSQLGIISPIDAGPQFDRVPLNGNLAHSVVEYRSSQRGFHIRYESGLQTCQTSRLRLEFESARSLIGTWKFPVSFADPPIICCTLNGATSKYAPSSDELLAPRVDSVTRKQVDKIRIYRMSGGTDFQRGDFVEVDVTASGQWK